MLSSTKKTELQDRMTRRLAGEGSADEVSGTVFFECSVEFPGQFGIDGLGAVTPGRIAFAASDILKGDLWHEWSRGAMRELRLLDDILGAVIAIESSGDPVKLTRVGKEDRQRVEDALARFGYTGARPVTDGQPDARPLGPSGHAEIEPQGLGLEFVPVDESDEDRDVGVEFLPAEQGQPEPARNGVVVCPACGRENKPHYRYCLGCGEDLEHAAARRSAPRTGASDVAVLVCTSGPSRGRTFPLNPGITKVGRFEEATIHIPAADLSRMHAVIEVSDKGCEIIDLGSANGTHVNGRSVNKAALRNGDTIRLGNDHEFVFVAAGSAVDTPAAARAHPRRRERPGRPADDQRAAKRIPLLMLLVLAAVAGLVVYFLLMD